MIAAEHANAKRQQVSAWHQASPNRSILDAADPPRTDGRYHRRGGTKTWYGSSSEAAAWAEFRQNPRDVDPSHARRRLGRVTYRVVALDLRNPELLDALGITTRDLTSKSWRTCQEIAEIAASVGFEAVVGPSAVVHNDATIAVFGAAIERAAASTEDRGVQLVPPGG